MQQQVILWYVLTRFATWLDAQRRPWHQPDLAAYRDYLLERGSAKSGPLAPSIVGAHLSTVRARYRELARDRDRLYAIVSQQTDDPLLRKALVDEMVARIENAIAPETAPVAVKTSQDTPDTAHLRLTAAQASALMAAPGLDSLPALRDTSLISLMLCTGIREAELRGLDVADLRQRIGGELALHVRQGKGCKERLVPYGELDWVLAIVEAWLQAAGIPGGAVFRGIWRGGSG